MNTEINNRKNKFNIWEKKNTTKYFSLCASICLAINTAAMIRYLLKLDQQKTQLGVIEREDHTSTIFKKESLPILKTSI